MARAETEAAFPYCAVCMTQTDEHISGGEL